MPSKIRLKRTPQEEEERLWRHARRAARKAHEAAGPSKYRPELRYHFKRHPSLGHDDPGPLGYTYQRSRGSPIEEGLDEDESSYSYGPSREEYEEDLARHYGREPRKSMADLRAEVEEEHFRAKMFDAALGDEDARLDSLEASFNAYVPPRWSHYSTSTPGAGPSGSNDTDSFDDDPNATSIDPSLLTDDQYAEWIRKGMWARSHRAEVESQERRAREREEARERARKARKEIEREEKEHEKARERKRAERERRKIEDAWDAYRARWAVLGERAGALSASVSGADAGAMGASKSANAKGLLRFDALPWPIHPSPSTPDSLTKEAISSFLLSPAHSPEKTRRQRIREALLAYHPDRYIGRYLIAVDPEQHQLVQEAVVGVTAVLNAIVEGDAMSKKL